jgi:putative FmdB family regulatory protein
MPIYEYECTSCCNVFEVFQRMTEDPLTNCPDCSGSVKKLVSMSSFQLKGGGWYADGYSSKSSNGSGSTATDKPTESASADKPTKNTSTTKDESTKSSPSDSSTATESKANSSATASTS